jgi:hypothetical protein
MRLPQIAYILACFLHFLEIGTHTKPPRKASTLEIQGLVFWFIVSTYGLIFAICFDNSGVKVVLSGFVSVTNVAEKVIGGQNQTTVDADFEAFVAQYQVLQGNLVEPSFRTILLQTPRPIL